MIVLNGKYNHAKVMIDHVDEATQSQIIGFLNHPAFGGGRPIVIMPDCHAGVGAVIGFTMPLGEHVIPSVVGVDIGCGVYAYRLGEVSVDFADFDAYIRRTIPSGASVHDHRTTMVEFLNDNLDKAIQETCNRIDENYPRTQYSVGTLGGGNHFLELAQASDGAIWFAVHTGSRHFGLAVANYHQNKAKELMKKMFHGASAYRGLEFLPMDLGGTEYLDDMHVAQDFAHVNRQAIAHAIVEGYFELDLDAAQSVQSVHNFIGGDGIIRKGAIAAREGMDVIIPLNMRDGSILARGLGNESWNYSAPHGAGRLLSRRGAKESLSLEEFTSEMRGIWSSCVSEKTLDESPMAYKDGKDILGAIGDTVQVIDFLKPIYNFKAS